MHTDPNDPLRTPQLTNDNFLTGSQDRQRQHDSEHLLKHSRGCLVNRTRNDSSMSETSDEEVDYGSPAINAISHTDLDHAWSTHGNDNQD
jgi:hypothetical protein